MNWLLSKLGLDKKWYDLKLRNELEQDIQNCNDQAELTHCSLQASKLIQNPKVSFKTVEVLLTEIQKKKQELPIRRS